MDEEYIFTLCLIAMGMVYYLAKGILKPKSDRSRESLGEAPASEAELLRDLHHGLARMEKRIDALETLLTERDTAGRATAGEKRP